MSESNTSRLPSSNGPGNLDLQERGLRPPAEYGFFRRLWWWFDFLILVKLARLRFIAILVAVGGIIAYWDTLSAYYEKWTRPLLGQQTATSPDTEFWCPMHPSIVRDHPDKCPICAMPLSKRKKGEKEDDEALPPGVVSRVQLTPYKVAVAGIETVEVGYQTLTRNVRAVGFVEFDEQKLARITARATGKSRIDRLFVNVTGQTVKQGDPLARLYSPDLIVTVQNLLDADRAGNQRLRDLARTRLRLWGIDNAQMDRILRDRKPITHLTVRSPISGHVLRKYQVEGEYVEEGARLFDVADLSTVWIEAQVYEDELALLREGLKVTATTRAFPNRRFEGKLAFIHPHLDASTRTLKVRFDMPNPGHDLRPGMYATVRLQVPVTELNLLAADAGAKQKEAYRDGRMLAVPERAVIDTGSRKFVYREAEPDVFEGVEVELGPRCGGDYPVVRGLKEGERVATTGSFLIDAETRLSAGASSTYFGASGGPAGDHRSATIARPSMTRDEDAKVQAVLANLDPADRRLAEEQGFCPVLNKRLGAMGVPVSVTLGGQKVFLCCKGCVKNARADEKATLARVAALKARQKKSPAGKGPAALSPGEAKEAARVRAALAKLPAADRKLAEAQRWCVVQTDKLLGSMGKPVKLLVKGQPVFLCCAGCEDEAKEDPDKTLATVEKLKARAASRERQRPEGASRKGDRP
jgi:multidrug efflux pump subunit AcrA (membrane-fusion protein)